LEDKGDAAAQRAHGQDIDRRALEGDAAFRGIIESIEEPNERRLAGAARSNERHNLAAWKIEVDAAERAPTASLLFDSAQRECDRVRSMCHSGFFVDGEEDLIANEHEA
jgi:hypothetical protein